MAGQCDLQPSGPGHRPQRRIAGRRNDQHEVSGAQALDRDLLPRVIDREGDVQPVGGQRPQI